MLPMRALLVEDDAAIASGLVRVLESQGYAVRHLTRGGPAPAAATPEVGLVILDLGLPDVDGLDVCRKLRAARPDLGVLILTARDQELDVVAGLDAGGDGAAHRQHDGVDGRRLHAAPAAVAVGARCRRFADKSIGATLGSTCVCRRQHRGTASAIIRGH